MKRKKQSCIQQTRVWIALWSQRFSFIGFFFFKFSNYEDLLNQTLCNQKLLLYSNVNVTMKITVSELFFVAFLRISWIYLVLKGVTSVSFPTPAEKKSFFY